MLNPNKVGLSIGLFYGLCHILWTLMVAMNFAKPMLAWVLSLHLLTVAYSVGSFQLSSAFILVIVTFIAGYLMGWLLAVIWNVVDKK